MPSSVLLVVSQGVWGVWNPTTLRHQPPGYDRTELQHPPLAPSASVTVAVPALVALEHSGVDVAVVVVRFFLLGLLVQLLLLFGVEVLDRVRAYRHFHAF